MAKNKRLFKNHIRGRVDDYDPVYRNKNPSNCVICSILTYFKDGVCSRCRTEVPNHIPFEQVKRYILRIKEGKQNAYKISERI